MAEKPDWITLYGKLVDKFADNGVVTVVAGQAQGQTLCLRLWLMSCRVLKRGMEDAMMDTLAAKAAAAGYTALEGYYYPTAKNAMGTALKKRPRMPMATPPGAWTLPLTIPAAPI